MMVSDPRTLDAIIEVTRTADRLARRMGGHYVMKAEWREAIEELHSQRQEAQSEAQARLYQPM